MKPIMKFTALLFLTFLFTQTGHAQDGISAGNRQYIKVEVNGLACPFCAYGLEKKMKKLEGAKDIHIFLKEGYAVMNVPANKVPTEKELKSLVADAGFETRKVTYSNKPFIEPSEKQDD